MTTKNIRTSILGVLVGFGMAGAAVANDDVLRLEKDPNQVVMPSITYNGWNFSGLNQINTGNAGDLMAAWTFNLGLFEQLEASPLVVGDTMYIIRPMDANGPGNVVFALDLNEDGRILWEFHPDISDTNRDLALKGACCGGQTRGLNYAEGKLFLQTLDGQVISLDAESGELLWRVQDVDLTLAETLTGNGLIAHDSYIIGVAGGERGVRGRVTAYNMDTGNLQWRYYNMGPDNEVGITEYTTPFYDDDKGPNVALNSWFGDSWRRGGGTVWGYFTWNPDTDLFHYSTGNCGPWNPDYRREWGVVDFDAKNTLDTYKNNYCASQMARSATTGELKWAYNIVPQDQWDIDQPLISPLVDINGTPSIIKAARNGYFYIWDEVTGEITNDPWQFVYVDFMTSVDKESGRPVYNMDDMLFTHAEDRLRYTTADSKTEAEIAALPDPDSYTGTEVEWCPGIYARNWQNDAYSPNTGLLYTSVRSPCRVMIVFEGEYVPGEGYTLQRRAGVPTVKCLPNGQECTWDSELQANDYASGRTAWSVKFTEASQSPILVTDGDVVFQGRPMDGSFAAYNAANGEELWSFRTGSDFTNSPVSYTGPDGRQYIAVVGSCRCRIKEVALDDAPDDADRYKRNGAVMYVFALPRSIAMN